MWYYRDRRQEHTRKNLTMTEINNADHTAATLELVKSAFAEISDAAALSKPWSIDISHSFDRKGFRTHSNFGDDTSPYFNNDRKIAVTIAAHGIADSSKTFDLTDARVVEANLVIEFTEDSPAGLQLAVYAQTQHTIDHNRRKAGLDAQIAHLQAQRNSLS